MNNGKKDKPYRKRGRKPIENPEKRALAESIISERDKKQKEAKRELALRELARRHLINFTQYRFPTYKVNWHHKVLAEALERVENGTTKRLIVNMPPRHGKSELVSVNFPAYCMGLDRDRSIITASYGADLATDFGRKVRNIMGDPLYKTLFNTRLAEDAKAKGSWSTNGRGEYNAVGVGGAITGKGGKIIIVDDYFKNREDADSEVVSEKLWDWYRSTLRTRLTPDGAMIIVACMTGDTIVTMANGYERELKDIRTGDYLSTYHNGKVKTSIVKNWASQGNDKVFTITTSCGIIVKANERHPFLIFNGKELKWIRLKNLSIGQKIVTLKGSGVSGKGSSALQMDVNKKLSVGDIVSHTTTKKSGLMDIVHRQIMQNTIVMHVLNNAMESLQKITKKCLRSNWGNVQYVKSHQRIMGEPIGVENFALTTTTQQEKLGVFSVMTAIWRWVIQKMNLLRWKWLNTSDFTLDEIISIEESGTEEVFDIEVDKTENFIANGVVSHNTRWRDNDLVGRILEEQALSSGEDWEIIKLEAIAEKDDEYRKEGEALWADHYTLENLGQTKHDIGDYEFASQYQQNPVNKETQVFKPELFKYIELQEVKDKITNCYVTIDSALSKKKNSDSTGVTINWVDDDNVWYLKSYKVKVDPTELIQLIFDLHKVYQPIAIGLEETTMTQAIDPFLTVEMAKKNIFPNVVALKHGGVNKETRIRGLLPRYDRGHIYHIKGLCNDLEAELTRFPASSHDDCIAEGSMILTSIGDVAIENIKVGDLVMTRGGLKPVLKVWDKGEKEVITKAGITATPDHRVITTTGEKHLTYVDESDILYKWNKSTQKIEKQLFIEDKGIIETQTQKDGNTESTTGDIVKETKDQCLCTDKSGLTTTEKSKKVSTSTTEMEILLTMMSLTSLSSQPQTTQATTQDNQIELPCQEKTLRKQTLLQRCGILVKKVWLGINNMLVPVSINLKKLCVLNVVKKQSKNQPTQSSVVENVMENTIPENLDKEIQTTTRKVYDLMVSEHHEFFVNGVLVHNCMDSLAYQVQIAEAPNTSFNYDEFEAQELSPSELLYKEIGI